MNQLDYKCLENMGEELRGIAYNLGAEYRKEKRTLFHAADALVNLARTHNEKASHQTPEAKIVWWSHAGQYGTLFSPEIPAESRYLHFTTIKGSPNFDAEPGQ